MQDHIGDTMVGTIAAVTNFGFFVRLNDIHIDGLVHVTGLISDYYIFDAGKQTLKGERTGRIYRIGDVLEVKVLSVNLDDKKIDFELADEAVAGQRKRGRKPESRKPEGKGSDRPIDKRSRNKKDGDKPAVKATEEELLAKRKAANKQKKKPQRKIAQGEKNTVSAKKKKTTSKTKRPGRAARSKAKATNTKT